jgi:hypothetical protein
MNAAPMTVLETPFFLRKAADLLDEEERANLVTLGPTRMLATSFRKPVASESSAGQPAEKAREEECG